MASSGGARTMRTFAQSASSSSAMIRGSEVMDPCPISVAADMMVIVPSGAIETHGLRAFPARSATSVAARAALPASTAKVRPAAPTMTWRRDSVLKREDRRWRVMSGLPGSALDSAHDPLVGAAAADVGAHVLDDLLARRLGGALQQVSRAHDLSRLAVAALRHVLGEPRLLQPVRGIFRKTLDGGHGVPRHPGYVRLARECPPAVDVHHAGAAQAGAAAELGAGEFQVLTDHPQQWCVRRRLGGRRLAIHVEADRHAALPVRIGQAIALEGFGVAETDALHCRESEPPRGRRVN